MSERDGWGKPVGLRRGCATGVAGVQFATDDGAHEIEKPGLAGLVNYGSGGAGSASRADWLAMMFSSRQFDPLSLISPRVTL